MKSSKKDAETREYRVVRYEETIKGGERKTMIRREAFVDVVLMSLARPSPVLLTSELRPRHSCVPDHHSTLDRCQTTSIEPP